MFEIEIDGKIYPFHFGIGFLREIDKQITKPIDGVSGAVQNMGFNFAYASLLDGDIEALINVLLTANKVAKGERIKAADLDAYIDDAGTDVDGLFAEVLGFLKSENATKKKAKAVDEYVKVQQASTTTK